MNVPDVAEFATPSTALSAKRKFAFCAICTSCVFLEVHEAQDAQDAQGAQYTHLFYADDYKGP